jgi:hypothetical protein
VGFIDSTDIARLPNAHEGNEYLRAYRLAPLHAIGFLRRFEQLRLPGPIALYFESPALMNACAGVAVAAAGLFCLALS